MHLLRGHWIPHLRQLRGARHVGRGGLRQLRRHWQGKLRLLVCTAEVCECWGGGGQHVRRARLLASLYSWVTPLFHLPASGCCHVLTPRIPSLPLATPAAGHVHQLPVHGQEAGHGARPTCGPLHAGEGMRRRKWAWACFQAESFEQAESDEPLGLLSGCLLGQNRNAPEWVMRGAGGCCWRPRGDALLLLAVCCRLAAVRAEADQLMSACVPRCAAGYDGVRLGRPPGWVCCGFHEQARATRGPRSSSHDFALPSMLLCYPSLCHTFHVRPPFLFHTCEDHCTITMLTFAAACKAE